MAGSLGLGIGFEEHHTENVAVLMDGWEAEVCAEGVVDPDCECCCQLFPPDTGGYPSDPDWTLIWGVDANGNIYPESTLYLSNDGFWETIDVGGTYAIIPVSVLYCTEIGTPAGVATAGCAGC